MLRFLEFQKYNKLEESLKKKKMIRDGKVVQKWKTTRPGTHRAEQDEFGNWHEVRMTPEEILNRKRGRRMADSKIEGQRDQIEKKKQLSMERRKVSDLRHYNKEFPDVNSEHDASTI